MAKRERNKRSARKARQQERERVAVAQEKASAGDAKVSKASAKKPAKAPKAIAKADRKGLQKVTGYFSDVRYEMHQVTWPSRSELSSYSVAVIASLIVFGVAIWLVDTGIVAALVQLSNLGA